jgi:hypothetical protein
MKQKKVTLAELPAEEGTIETKQNGTIFLWSKSESGFDIVTKAIQYFTGSPYTHVAVYLRGSTYDCTVWKPAGRVLSVSGVRETLGVIDGWQVELKPATTLTSSQTNKMMIYCKMQIDARRPYNVFKLLAFILIYPTRWFWNKIKWVPFKAELFGEVCSTFVDQTFKAGGVDLFKNLIEEVAVPGDYIDTPLLEIVNG